MSRVIRSDTAKPCHIFYQPPPPQILTVNGKRCLPNISRVIRSDTARLYEIFYHPPPSDLDGLVYKNYSRTHLVEWQTQKNIKVGAIGRSVIALGGRGAT